MLRRFLTYITSIVLIAIYIVSYIGFSVHTCTCEQTTQISVLIGNPTCENLHAHINLSKDGNRCDCHHDHHHSAHHASSEKCESNHQDGCCSTEVLVMTSEQTNPDYHAIYNSLLSWVESEIHYPIIAEVLHMSDTQELGMNTPTALLRQDHSFISIWRL